MGRRSLAVVVVLGLVVSACSASAPDPTDRQSDGPTAASDSPGAPAIDYLTPSCLMARADTDLRDTARGLLEPGTYSYCGVGQRLVNVRFTVPAGWEWHGSHLSKGGIGAPDGAAIAFFAAHDLLVYEHPCQWAGPELDLEPGDNVQDIADALAAQPMRSATSPTERYAAVPDGTVGDMPARWPGLTVELTVPDDIDFADCDGGEFRSWGPDAVARAHDAPGQHDLVWVVTHAADTLHTPGDLLIIDAATFAGTPAGVLSEIEAILESIAIGHWG